MRYHGNTGGDRIPVRITAEDPVSRAGLAGQLRTCPEVRLLDGAGQDGPDESDGEDGRTVVVVAVDKVGEEALRTLRQLRRTAAGRIVLVGTELDDAGLVAAVECGVVGVVRRREATAERLVQVIIAAARGEGSVPADLLGRLLEQVGRLQRQVLDPRGLAFTGLAPREVEVLRLVAAGRDTAEIAEELSFSERTVKNVLHEVTTRLQLRNRSHAVAYALREGLI
ncbi:response regulator transcription factor [Kitasatospora sp. NPDC059722]|uniref:response regulator transcription factor n=1 Tax=Kitasatospora sp. NPDC059722 TaxID=3346925 RepID=UPI00368A34CC